MTSLRGASPTIDGNCTLCGIDGRMAIKKKVKMTRSWPLASRALKSFVAGYPNLPQRAEAERSFADAKAVLQKAVLENAMRGQKTKYNLVIPTADPFYAPGDPVIAITGPAMEALGTDPRTLTVRCRVTGEELQKFAYREICR